MVGLQEYNIITAPISVNG